MRCPKCQTENLADSLFCEECSAPLEAACPTCGAGNRPTAKFCRKCRAALALGAVPEPRSASPDPRSYTPKHLADKILTSRSALEGERKQVTVLFADVKGSMDLAEPARPGELARASWTASSRILADGVHRFEGTVNQYTGDGIMALFGAPIAHEDHAQRACYAALTPGDGLRTYAREVQARARARVLGAHGHELRRGGGRQDRRRSAHGLHRPGPHGRPRGAHGEPGGAREGLPHERNRRAREGLLRARGPRRVHGQGRQRSGARLRAARRRRAAHALRRLARPRPHALRRPRRGHAGAGVGAGERQAGQGTRARHRRQRGRRQEPSVLRVHRALPGRRPHRPPGQRRRRTGRTFRCCRSWRSSAATSASTSATTLARSREKIAGRLLLIDDSFRDVLPLVFDFVGVPGSRATGAVHGRRRAPAAPRGRGAPVDRARAIRTAS